MSLNRSFSRRIGKTLSTLQKNLLETDLPQHLFTPDSALIKNVPLFLEIGFGMGEHFIKQASQNPNAVFIGAEPYLNGVANVLKLAKIFSVKNFLLWSNDVDLILERLANKSVDGVYILFPDPWPKRRQLKKRIFSQERLKIIETKLKNNGFLVFASDIEDYFLFSKKLIIENGNFELLSNDFYQPHNGYVITKYHQKAQYEGREARFIQARLK